MLVLTLIFEIYLYMLREVFEVAVIPDKPHFVNQDKGIRWELIAAEVLCFKLYTAGNFTVTENIPALFLILQSKLCHKSSLARTFAPKTHIELVRVAILKRMVGKRT